jgi:DNA-binding CsgD family transcriptional regulator
VAVLGDDADPRQAAELAELDQSGAADAAEALAAAGIFEPGRPFRFIHPLVRNAVYVDLPAAEKAAMHGRAAAMLGDAGAEPERIAVHLLATDPEGEPTVVEILTEAARRALDRAAPEAAIAYARRALAEPPDPAARRELLRHLTTASLFTMTPEALEHLHSDVVEEVTADPEALLASTSELSPLLLTYGRASEGLALLERAARAAREVGDYDLLMRFEAQIVTWAHLSPAREAARWKRYEERIEPDTPAERLLLTMKAASAAFAGEPASTVADLARRSVEGGAIIREQRDGVVSSMPIFLLLRTDDLDVAERAIELYGSAARARGTALIAGSAYLRAELAYLRGEIARAEPDARAAVEAARQGGFPLAFPLWASVLTDVLIERGELDAADHELEASGMHGNLPDDFWFNPVLHSRGCLRLAQGRSDEGLEDLLEAGSRSLRHGLENAALLPTAAVAAIEFARLRDRKPARGLLEMYRRMVREWGTLSAVALTAMGKGRPARGMAELYLRNARAWGTPRTIGIGLHALGVVEGGEKGIRRIREAVASLERSPARLDHAKALTDLGAALRRANRRAEAREPLREGLEMARRGGALAVAQRAHEELEATGEKLRPLVAGGVESLTPSERRIAELAAEGRSNREIAQSLFLTVKTVETHLSNSYRKLDISSRRQLGPALSGETG